MRKGMLSLSMPMPGEMLLASIRIGSLISLELDSESKGSVRIYYGDG